MGLWWPSRGPEKKSYKKKLIRRYSIKGTDRALTKAETTLTPGGKKQSNRSFIGHLGRLHEKIPKFHDYELNYLKVFHQLLLLVLVTEDVLVGPGQHNERLHIKRNGITGKLAFVFRKLNEQQEALCNSEDCRIIFQKEEIGCQQHKNKDWTDGRIK